MKMIEWVENKKIKNFKKKIFGFDEKSIKKVSNPIIDRIRYFTLLYIFT